VSVVISGAGTLELSCALGFPAKTETAPPRNFVGHSLIVGRANLAVAHSARCSGAVQTFPGRVGSQHVPAMAGSTFAKDNSVFTSVFLRRGEFFLELVRQLLHIGRRAEIPDFLLGRFHLNTKMLADPVLHL